MTLTSPPHQAIYRRWRAQTFSAIVGQEAVVETLRNAVRTGRVAHAILFVGPRGTGKTSLARILAKALNCTDLRDGDPCDACEACVAIREGATLDVIEIDAASNRGIDDVRELRDRLAYPPTHLKRKVYILDEAHQITKDAWNALLKSLEEPPEFVSFMFASTQPQGFPPAILSRLQRYDVRRLTVAEIEGKLTRILEADGRQAEPAAVSLIARLAAGGMRDAESMLDQLLASSGDRLDQGRVRELLGLADAEAVHAFADALATGDAAVGMRVLDALEDRGRDLRVFLDQVVEAFRDELREAAAGGPQGRHPPALIASAARRLAAIDPSRAGLGGLRLQLEVALFGATDWQAPMPAPAPAAAATTTPPRLAPTGEPDAAAAPARSVKRTTPSPQPTPERPAERPADPPAVAEPPVGPPAIAEPPPTPPDEAPAASLPAPAASASDPGTDVGPDLALLRDRWPEIVAHVSQNPAAKPLVTACRPIAVDGNIVTLGFPESQEWLKNALERRRQNLEEGVARFLGREVTVRCVATNLELVPPLPADADSAFLLSEARRIFADDLVDVGEVR